MTRTRALNAVVLVVVFLVGLLAGALTTVAVATLKVRTLVAEAAAPPVNTAHLQRAIRFIENTVARSYHLNSEQRALLARAVEEHRPLIVASRDASRADILRILRDIYREISPALSDEQRQRAEQRFHFEKENGS